MLFFYLFLNSSILFIIFPYLRRQKSCERFYSGLREFNIIIVLLRFAINCDMGFLIFSFQGASQICLFHPFCALCAVKCLIQIKLKYSNQQFALQAPEQVDVHLKSRESSFIPDCPFGKRCYVAGIAAQHHADCVRFSPHSCLNDGVGNHCWAASVSIHSHHIPSNLLTLEMPLSCEC